MLIQALDEFLLHHAVDSYVEQVGDEGVAGSSADAFTASEVEQDQRGEALQIGQAAIGQLIAAFKHTQTHI